MKCYALLVFVGSIAFAAYAAEAPKTTVPLSSKNSVKIQPRPESGPFGNITSRPGAAAPATLTLAPVEGTLSDDALREAKALSPFSSGRLVYFVFGTLQPTKIPEVKTTGKSAPATPRPIQGYFLVDRTFAKDKAPVVKLYQVRGPQKVRPEAPLFFPDGKKLLFQVDDGSRGPNSYRLYVADLADKNVKRLELDAVAIRNVEISPDGRYLAISGAGAMGERGWNPQAAPQLLVYDLQTGKSRELLKNDLYNRLPLGVAWSGDNKLLFSLMPKVETEEAPPVKPDTTKPDNTKPDSPKPDDKTRIFRPVPMNAPILSTIYEATPEGEPQRLFQGYAPLPSPDGKWLSFIGLRDVNQPTYLMPHVCLFDRKTLKRYTGLPSASNAQWSPDSHQLIISEAHRQEGVPQLRLYGVNMDKWQTQEIADLSLQSAPFLARNGAPLPVEETKTLKQETTTIKATTKETTEGGTSSPRAAFTAQWKPLLISPDGSTLYAQVKTYSSPNPRGLSTEVWNLQSVNLRDGTTSLLGALPDASGVAWFMEAPPPAP